MSKKIGVIGSGPVGVTLANGFRRFGYEVMIGTRTPAKRAELQAKAPGVNAGTFEEAASYSEIAVLAVKGIAAESVVRSLSARLNGKTVIDATNAIADTPPVHGVIQLFTSPAESLMERLQRIAPGGHFVKAFNSAGHAFMVKPDFGGIQPSMFICGNDEGAKAEVSKILETFGWEVVDMGMQESARAIEQLVVLWCIPGFLRNEWNHAYKLLRK